MAYTAPEDSQRLRAVYAINPDFQGIWGGFLAESFDFKQFKSRVV